MKTIKTWLTTIAVLLCCITANAHDFMVDGIYYNILSDIEQTVEVTWYNSESGSWPTSGSYSDEVIDIPSNVLYEGTNYSVKRIGEWAFSNCKKTLSITIPDGVSSIGAHAFSGCWELTSVIIPHSVTEIGMYAFDNCKKLLAIEIPQGLKILERNVFSACTSLTYVAIPTSVVEIGDWAFSSCGSLTSIIIPEGVTSIGESAFYNCYNLISILIPKSVNSIGNSLFAYCDNLKKVFWKSSVLPESYGRSVTYTANNDYASSKWFKVYPMLGNMFEVDGVTYIPTSISERTCDVVDYDYYRTATSVNVGATVTYKNTTFTVNNINDYAFYGNQHLEEVTFANQGSIRAYALSGCSELTSVNLAEGVTSIGENAFDACNKLASFALPASVTSLDKALFNGCNGLTAITVAAENTQYDSRNNCNAIIEKESNKLIAACSETLIPASVTAIGDYAFSACGKMTSITIHKDILSIGNYAFSGCTGLADVTIENRTEVLTLGSNGNKALFSDCPLSSVYIGGKISYNTSSSYGYSPFSNNASLRTVTITDKEDTIYPYEFYNCSALTDVTIGDGVTTIGDYAFSGCTALERFAFGSCMETIGTKAFLGCGKMTKIESGAVNPPVCGDNALDDLNKWNCTLYMPVGYMDAYKAADQWKEFLLMEDNIPIKKYTLTFMVDGNVYHTCQFAYNETIVLPDNPQKEGYSFDGWEGLPETMPISDIIVNALFALNEYTLTYIVDGVEYKTESIAYGSKLILLEEPVKEGHTFSGWSEAPETMPANDVTIEGSFTVNNYMLTYVIDGTLYKEEPVAYGSAIKMLEAPEKSGYTFDGWDKTLTVMPAEDVVINGSYTRMPIENYTISDSDKCFAIEDNLQCNNITYTRIFSNTNWQALYVPFEIPVTEDFLEDFEIADLNDVRQYDRDNDGVKDETVIEAFKVTSGTLAANYPYLIRAKEIGEKIIVVTDATLYATEENSYDCSSLHEMYTFTGTYSASDQFPQGEGYYTLLNGEWQPIVENTTLGAFRFYLKVDSRDNSEIVAKTIRMRIVDEDEGEDDGSTGMEQWTIDNGQLTIYDLQGRKVTDTENLKGGVYIINGRKVVIGD